MQTLPPDDHHLYNGHLNGPLPGPSQVLDDESWREEEEWRREEERHEMEWKRREEQRRTEEAYQADKETDESRQPSIDKAEPNHERTDIAQ